MLSRLRKRCALTVALLGLFALTAGPAAADDPAPPPWLKVENGQTQPQFDFAQAIEEVVFVETELDSDGDGARDRVRIQISRPAETDDAGLQGAGRLRAQPVPRRLRRRRQPRRRLRRAAAGEPVRRPRRAARSARAARSKRARATSARARARARSARADLPGSSLDNYYVPRGYAVVLGESIGTFNSDGCPTVGDRVETLGTKAVIDWLNGRARGFDAAGNEVEAGLDHRRRRHDRRLLQRHAAQPGRDDRRRGPRDDHPGLGDLQLVRLLPRQRARRGAALRDAGRRRERLPRRGHRRARVFIGGSRDGRRALRLHDPVPACASRTA